MSALIKTLESRIETARGKIINFSERLLEDPASALDYSSDHFQDAAKIEVYSQAIALLNKGATEGELKAHAELFIFTSIGRVNNSTSQTSNLMTASRMYAWSAIVQAISFDRLYSL